MSLTVRPMSVGDLGLALEWARLEGWNPGLDDAEPFHTADPSGFLMGWIDDEPVASISAAAYGKTFGFIGLYICRPEYRGRGHGKALWDVAINRLAGRSIGLDGVPAQVTNYQRSGFVYAYGNRRFSGSLRVDPPSDPRLVPVTSSLAHHVASIDNSCFPQPRPAFLASWLRPLPHRAGLALVEDGSVTGYGVIRDCQEGHKIGPLFASSAADADILFRGLAALRAAATIIIDMPEPNREATALAERYGMNMSFETARMYRGPAPALPLDRIFGVTSLELG